jgi:uncharacterized membrane protein
MSEGVKRGLIRFLLFALIGLLIEVFFTSISNLLRGNWNMRGSTSPWMMIDYGLLGVALMPLARPMIRRGWPLPVRALVYMLGIFLVEYVSGLIFTAAGLSIWNYSHLPYNLQGQITLLYAPFWFALGLVVEWLYRRIDAIALVLLRGWTAADLSPDGVPGKITNCA